LRLREVTHYIQHRLEVAGSKGLPYFTGPAIWRIHRYSQGIPRVINTICDKCLLAGYVQQRDRVDHRMVGLAIRELEGKIDV
jgi:general secretion pathway protein A